MRTTSTKHQVRKIKRYGSIPSLPDERDLVFKALPTADFTNLAFTALPTTNHANLVDLRPQFPRVYSQGNLASCTGNALAGIFQFEMIRQKLATRFTPSRLFIYFNERVMEGTVSTDSGARIRDGLKSLAKQGVCSEKLWPYVISKFAKKPTLACYKAARKSLTLKYMRVHQDLSQLKGTLAMGIPVVFGFVVYDSFESRRVAKTGIVPMPKPGEKQLGGHAVVLVGYNEKTQMFIVRNSYGRKWGKNGYFLMPYKYVLDANLCYDFWMIQSVS